MATAAADDVVEPLLEVRDIHTYYGHSYVLQGVSMRIFPGEVVAILGRNGVGKTTLIRSLMGFTPPRRGDITFAGRDITAAPAHRIARLGMALVPQGRRLFPSLSVRETLDVAAHLKRFDEAGRSWPMERLYDLFPRLKERREQRASSLSGGEQQMLATARALVGNPRLALLDEPSEGLSPLIMSELEKLVRTLRDEDGTVLLVEQRISFALDLADRVFVMNKGQIVLETSPDEFRADADTRHRYLGV